MIFYADLYVSYQRGTNERFNREMRSYIPKGYSFDVILQKTIDVYDSFLNTRLLKRHDLKSPKELFEEEIEKIVAPFSVDEYSNRSVVKKEYRYSSYYVHINFILPVYNKSITSKAIENKVVKERRDVV